MKNQHSQNDKRQGSVHQLTHQDSGRKLPMPSSYLPPLGPLDSPVGPGSGAAALPAWPFRITESEAMGVRYSKSGTQIG